MTRLMAAGVLLFSAAYAQAVETAPRLTDREIIEGLAEIRAEQKVLSQRIDVLSQRIDGLSQRVDDLEKSMNARFEAIDKRFESIDRRFESIDKRFESLEQTINARFDQLINLMLGITATFGGIVAVTIGFAIWDRRTTLRPVEARIAQIEKELTDTRTRLYEKMEALEQDLQRDLELQKPEGSKLTRLIHALSELAKTDEKVAAVMKSFSLL